MNNITFNSKDTYLAYRFAWKAACKNLSAEIRLLRQAAAPRRKCLSGLLGTISRGDPMLVFRCFRAGFR